MSDITREMLKPGWPDGSEVIVSADGQSGAVITPAARAAMAKIVIDVAEYIAGQRADVDDAPTKCIRDAPSRECNCRWCCAHERALVAE